MLDLFFLLLIIFGFISASSVLYLFVQRFSRRVESGEEVPSLLQLREEMESMAGRVDRMEEELEFYKRLKAPTDPGLAAERPRPESPNP